jgi:type VI protein secretion system component VasF
MAFSMEEQRILTEIASQLSEDDPAFARRLTRFGRPRRRPRHGRRARLVVAVVLAVVVVAAAVAVTVALAAI